MPSLDGRHLCLGIIRRQDCHLGFADAISSVWYTAFFSPVYYAQARILDGRFSSSGNHLALTDDLGGLTIIDLPFVDSPAIVDKRHAELIAYGVHCVFLEARLTAASTIIGFQDRGK